MKTVKTLTILLSLAVISSQAQTLDLSVLKFGQSAQSYNLDQLKTYRTKQQAGHYEVTEKDGNVSLDLKDNGEKLTNYIFMDESTSQLNFDGLEVDPMMGAELSVYNQNIAYLKVKISSAQTTKLIDYLLAKEGTPTQIITRSQSNDDISTAVQDELKKAFPKESVKSDGEFTFPERVIWVKDDVIYMLTLMPADNFLPNSLVIITKKTLKDKVIYGYHTGKDDFILGKYLK